MYAVTKDLARKPKKNKRSTSLFGRTNAGSEDVPQLRPHLDTIDNLCRSTQFTRSELRTLYRGFKQDCPYGYLTEDTLKQIYSQVFPAGDSRMYAHFVFKMLDSDESGSVTFEQMVSCTSEMSRGTASDKLKWIYSMYDVNRDGKVTKDGMKKVLEAIYEMTGKFSSGSTVLDDVVDRHANAVIMQMDLNGDGTISREDFIEACRKDHNILESLETMDTII